MPFAYTLRLMSCVPTRINCFKDIFLISIYFFFPFPFLVRLQVPHQPLPLLPAGMKAVTHPPRYIPEHPDRASAPRAIRQKGKHIYWLPSQGEEQPLPGHPALADRSMVPRSPAPPPPALPSARGHQPRRAHLPRHAGLPHIPQAALPCVTPSKKWLKNLRCPCAEEEEDERRGSGRSPLPVRRCPRSRGRQGVRAHGCSCP